MRERVNTTVTSLLGLLGIDADPIRSREHILISNILNSVWMAGQDLDIAALIQQIQTPPMTKVGVMDLDSFFPSKERFELALALNNLLAAPAFASWMEGEPLDVQQLLHSADGKPRISIFSIAHLNDAERMFFVSLLLNQTLGWMRTQSGTTSLRAILYMDEIFGYFPPVANPPSKVPLLTLLKQGRAFGLGVVLVTQNPVDLDYKGLSNTGTWFIGRLQTERDKDRVLEGLEGVAAGSGLKFDRQRDGTNPGRTGEPDLRAEQCSRRCARSFRKSLGHVVLARPVDPQADQDSDGSCQSTNRNHTGRRNPRAWQQAWQPHRVHRRANQPIRRSALLRVPLPASQFCRLKSRSTSFLVEVKARAELRSSITRSYWERHRYASATRRSI